MRYRNILSIISLIMILLISGCQRDEITSPESAGKTDGNTLPKSNGNVSAVFTQTNSTSGNEVLMFSRSGQGSLTYNGAYATGGLGTGAGLGSQGSLALRNGFLFVVNAGSNEVSVFSADKTGLTLLDKISSGGTFPISLAAYGNLLYVLNAGGTANITGFTVNDDGTLTPISGSTKPLSVPAPAPAQVEFSPDGNFLVVTEKATNQIDVYTVVDGVANGPVVSPSAGVTPFGFAFDKRGDAIVSEAFGGAANAGAVSSYAISGAGADLITGPVYDNQTAPCWVVVTQNGKFAYTTNAGSASISGYYINQDGSLTLFDDGGNTASTGPSPIDMAVSNNSNYLYALTAAGHSIDVFEINNGSGNLSSLLNVTVPAGCVGLAAN